ncbi:MAG: hypothetical protein QOH21_834, partial [Acidobacteriota bacterium]|nr:hypothetical protein [Acidobacteriota bacterium]
VVILVGGVALLMYGTKLMEDRMLRERDDILKTRLGDMRQALRDYHERERAYPESLDKLVPAFLPVIPVDPVTRKADWRLITEETVTPNDDFARAQAPKSRSVIVDVKSAAAGAGRDGVAYADY